MVQLIIFHIFKREKYCLLSVILYLLQRHANTIENYTRYCVSFADTLLIFKASLNCSKWLVGDLIEHKYS